MESRELFLEVAASRGLPCPEQLFSRRPVSEDLAWANVVMTPFSTMAIEAAYADCLPIWLSFGPFRYEIRETLVANGYGCPATSTTQLYEALLACRDDNTRSCLIDQTMKVGHRLGVLNQNAAMDAAKCMAPPPICRLKD